MTKAGLSPTSPQPQSASGQYSAPPSSTRLTFASEMANGSALPAAPDAGSTDGGPKEAAPYVSCAYTSEPAQPPCTQYLGIRGGLHRSAASSMHRRRALSAATCTVNRVSTNVCSLVVDASSAGIGSPIVACGCE